MASSLSILPIGTVPGSSGAALAAGGILFLGFAAGIYLNLRSMQRPGTNRNAAYAAIYAFAAPLPLLIGAVLHHLQIFSSPFIVAGPAAILSIIIAVVFAANALTEMNKFRERWLRGRRRAIAVLVVPVVLALTIVAGVVAHSSGHPIFAGLVSGTAGENLIDKARNYSLSAPPPWVRTDPQRLDPAACATFARKGPEMFASVVIQPLTADSDAPFDLAVAAVKSQIGRSQNGEVLDVQPQSENGLRGIRVESVFGPPSDRQFQVHYLVHDGRSSYQLLARGADGARVSILVEARKLAAGFRLIDPNPIVQAKPAKLAVTFVSPKFGYSVDLTKTVWNRAWPTQAKEVPFAEFGILNERSSAAFCVIPVWLGDDDLDLDILSNALTVRLGIPFVRDSLLSLRTVRQGPLRGQAFGAEQTQGETRLLYRMRVVRGRGFAYLLAAWMNKAMEASPEFLDLALNCVSFAEKAPEPALIGERPRTTHSMVWNDIGNGLFGTGKFDAALGWFKRSFELENNNLSALVNYSETCLQLKRPAEAVGILDEHIGRFPGNSQLVARRAAALFQAGDAAAAIKAYATVFATGWREDTEFARYLSVLANQNRHTDAMAALDRYAAGHDSPELKQMRAQLIELGRRAAPTR